MMGGLYAERARAAAGVARACARPRANGARGACKLHEV